MDLSDLKIILNGKIPFDPFHHLGPILKAYDSINCSDLHRPRTVIPSTSPSPTHIPEVLKDDYTLGGLVPTLERYYDGSNRIPRGYNWSKADIESQMTKPNVCGSYNQTVCEESIKGTAEKFIKDKVGAVIGSITPWAESALLRAGAAGLTTIEYTPIRTDHPKIKTLTPTQAAQQFLEQKWEPVDFVWSYSSIEHDGLGRYGDPLNPYGDLEAVARMYCLLKPGGVLYLGIPMGPDAVVWNAHRIYGRLRLPLLLRNFQLIDLFGDFKDVNNINVSTSGSQPVMVLKKPLSPKHQNGHHPRHKKEQVI